VQAQHRARLAVDDVLIIGVDQKGERGAVRSGGRLDDVREVVLARLLVEEAQVLAAELGVAAQVEVAVLKHGVAGGRVAARAGGVVGRPGASPELRR
jgi:hypothetical protein